MTRLVDAYAGLVCDLDGVVYRGAHAVPHAVEALDAAREAGIRVAYATNNAARPPVVVRDHLAGLGLTLETSDVVTSSMAGAHRIAEIVPAGSRVLAIGGEGVALALEEEDLRPVRAFDLAGEERADFPVAVLQGFGPDVAWHDLAQGAAVVQHGGRWVATNTDLTIPLARGIAPGNGSMVGALRHAVDVDPEVVGKPYPPLYLRAAERLGLDAEKTLAIGDRLDTDIEGANRTGMDSLFVLTGVNGAWDVATAPELLRPTHLAADLRALHEEYRPAQILESGDTVTATCGKATVEIEGENVHLRGEGAVSDRLRAVAAGVWRHLDLGHAVPDGSDVDAWVGEGR